MTEVEVGSVVQQEVAQAPAASAGQMLREAREGRHMTIQALASALKVPVAKLQALEDDRWDVLSDVVFTRAVALSICRVLQIESAPILALLPKAAVSKLSTNPEGINTPFKEKTLRSSMSSASDNQRGRTLKLLAVLAIVLAGGAGLYFVPQWKHDASDTVSTAPDGVDIGATALVSAIETKPEVVAGTQTAVSAPAMAVALPEAASVPPTSVSAPVAVSAPEPVPQVSPDVESAAVASVSAPALATESKAAVAAPALRIAVSEQAWVQVRNAQQQVVMEKIMQSGDVFETNESRPLSVVIGNASASRVEIDGVALDLARSAKNNVARFEVK